MCPAGGQDMLVPEELGVPPGKDEWRKATLCKGRSKCLTRKVRFAGWPAWPGQWQRGEPWAVGRSQVLGACRKEVASLPVHSGQQEAPAQCGAKVSNNLPFL
jgi:hypothetical protein